MKDDLKFFFYLKAHRSIFYFFLVQFISKIFNRIFSYVIKVVFIVEYIPKLKIARKTHQSHYPEIVIFIFNILVNHSGIYIYLFLTKTDYSVTMGVFWIAIEI